MSGKGLSDLVADLKEEAMPAVEADTLPDFGGFQEPPPPGAYRFKLPDLSRVFELFDLTPDQQRLRVIFDRDAPLTIVGGSHAGETFHTRLSNVKRARGKDKSVEASDLDYLLKALGEKTTPTSNRAYMETLAKYSGREFGGDVSYNWTCSPTRNVRAKDASGQSVEIEGKRGCGWRYYPGDGKLNAAKKVGYVSKHEGVYPQEIECQCGAVLRAFSNLDAIRA
jgi:hypothetical protein